MKVFSIKIIVVLLIANSVNLYSQNEISLKAIIDSTMKNYPISNQANLYNEQLTTQTKTAINNNLPKIQLNARATYQNEVTELDIKIPGFQMPELSKDQYRLGVDIQQSIYNGNVAKAQKVLYKTQNEASIKKMEIELYNVKKTIIELVFGVVFNSEQKKLLRSYQKKINEKTNEIEALVSNGVLLKTSLNAINLENIKLKQQIYEVENDKIKLIKNINTLSGLPIDTSYAFIIDEYSITDTSQQQRAEYKLMEVNQIQLQQQEKLISAKYLPNIYAFGTLGYGRPGYNMLSNNFSEYYMLGVGFNWNVWSWHEEKHEKQILQINSKIIDTQKEAFLKGIEIQLQNINSEIINEQKLIETDDEIINLQTEIEQTSEILLKNGTITTSQYITELQKNEENKLNKVIHKIKLNLSKVNYLLVQGLL